MYMIKMSNEVKKKKQKLENIKSHRFEKTKEKFYK